jgi:hypothetical protein
MSVVGPILVAVDFESLSRGLLLFLFLQLGHMMTDRQEALYICFVNQCVQKVIRTAAETLRNMSMCSRERLLVDGIEGRCLWSEA